MEISSEFLKIHGSRSFPGTGYFFMCMRRDRCKTFVCVCEHAAAKSSLLTKQWSHRFYLFFLCLTGLVMSCAGEREGISLSARICALSSNGVQKIALTVKTSGRWKADRYNNCCNQIK